MSKIAVISGAASGIGNCLAVKMKERGVRVFGIDINKVNIKGITAFKCDVSDETQVVSSINEIGASVDRIDYLLNVAGIFCCANRYYIEDLPSSEWDRVMDVNLKGTFLLTKYLIPFIRKSQCGNIINFSSEQVVLPQTRSAPYVITKAAIEMLTRVTALELMDAKIRVNTVALASVHTNFLKSYKNDDALINGMMLKSDQSMPFGLITPEDIFELVWYLLSDSNKMTGQTVLIDSGIILRKQKIGSEDALYG